MNTDMICVLRLFFCAFCGSFKNYQTLSTSRSLRREKVFHRLARQWAGEVEALAGFAAEAF